MRRFYTGLILVTIVMVLLAFAIKWFNMDFFAPVPMALLPVTALYFAVVDGLQYWLTLRSMNKKPMAFIQFFLASTVAVLFLHILALVGGIFSNPAGGKRFAVGFLACYVVYTAYIMAGFIGFVKRASKD